MLCQEIFEGFARDPFNDHTQKEIFSLVVACFIARFKAKWLHGQFLYCVFGSVCNWQKRALIKVWKATSVTEAMQDCDVAPGRREPRNECRYLIFKTNPSVLHQFKNSRSCKQFGDRCDWKHILYLHRHIEFDVRHSVRPLLHNSAVLLDDDHNSGNLVC